MIFRIPLIRFSYGIPHFENPNFVPWLDKAQQVNLPTHAAPRNPIQHEAVSSDASSDHNSKLVQDGTSLALKYLEIQQRRLGSAVIPRPPFVLSFSARGSQARWRPVVPGIYTSTSYITKPQALLIERLLLTWRKLL